jgi:nucleoside-diphosphate-sugar epimerase
MKVLITGVTGFVMASLARYLSREGYEVTGIDKRLPDEITKKFWGLENDKIKLILGDVGNWGTFDDFKNTTPFNAIIHGAAITPDPKEEFGEKTSRIIEVNIIGTINALRFALLQGNLKKFVYISSTNVYQPSNELLSEECTLNPASLYGITKLAGEHIVRRYHEEFDLPVVSTRITSVYGAAEYATPTRQNPSFMYQCATKALQNVPIRISSPEQKADWVYAEDVSFWIHCLINTTNQQSLVYNLSNGIPITAVEAIHLIQKELPQMNWSIVDTKNANVTYPSGNRFAVSDRIKQQSGLDFQFNIQTGVKHYMNEFKAIYLH